MEPWTEQIRIVSMIIGIGLLLVTCCPTSAVQDAKVPAVAKSEGQALHRILERYAEWRGGTAYERLQTIHQKGALEAAGLTGTEELWTDRQGRVRLVEASSVLNQTQVISPESSWDTSPSGQVETLSVSDHHSVGRLEALQFLGTLKGQRGSQTSLLGFEERQQRTWAVLRITFGDEDTYDAYIDPNTGELLGFHIVEDQQQRFESFSDWRFVEGVRMPFLHTTKADDPGDDTTVKESVFSINQPLASKLFARPIVARKAVFAEGASSTGWIPFELWSGNRIYLPAEVNGNDVQVLLDSGATVSSIDKAYAASIGLTAKGSFSGSGSGGTETFGFISGVKIQVDNLTLRDVNVGAFHLTPVASNIGRSLPFVLGDEIFNELAVDIDFEQHRIRFFDPAAVTRPSGFVEVPLTRIKDRTVPISVESRPAVPFEFDLGNGAPLDIFPVYYKRQRLLENRRTSQKLGGGVGGFHPETIATLRAINFAGESFVDVPANFDNETQSSNNSHLILGSVGIPILSRFHLIIDYSHDRLLAAPLPNKGEPFATDRLGLYCVAKDYACIVNFVSPGSPAELAGIQVGNAIAYLNQLAGENWTEADLRALRNAPAGTVVVMTLFGGTVRKVTLADYF